MRYNLRSWFASAWLLAVLIFKCQSPAEMILGDPPQAPKDLAGLPGGGPMAESVTGGFSVNTSSREQVRAFYIGVYASSDGIPMDTTADVSTCTPGTNSTAFQEGVLRRINWFRAMGGVPAVVTLSQANNTNNQQGAVIMSANNALSHFPPPSWTCYSGPGAHAASNSNIALGSSGADSITGYIWDFGANNFEVGHRRWILYPQTQVMGTGDVPAAGGYAPANTTWVFDANFGGPRPATRHPYVSWPPEGFVPYQVVYPQWSCGLTNANFTNATVTMTSNGVSIAVSIQPYLTGFGENTLVWVPMGLDATSESTKFPFNGADTVYGITIGNIKVGASTISLSYNVTVFDPAVPGADYVAPAISGPSRPIANVGNLYFCQSVNNSNVTSYQWRITQRSSGNLVDNAQNGLINFTISPPPDYPIITNAADGSGKCFHLAHPDQSHAVPQLLQFNEVLFPSINTTLSFASMLQWASSDEVARVQASSDGGTTWQDLYTQPGADAQGETTFSPHTLSLSNYTGKATLLRFNYDVAPGGLFYPYNEPDVGWSLENIVLTNTEQVTYLATNSTPSTNFTFTPTQTGNYNLEAQGVIFTEFPLDWGPIKQVTVVPSITMADPVLSGTQLRLDFTSAPASTGLFKLLQASPLGSSWTTNTSATFTTNVPGTSYRFTTTNGPGAKFYRILEITSP